jgi:hypothetical protein
VLHERFVGSRLVNDILFKPGAQLAQILVAEAVPTQPT